VSLYQAVVRFLQLASHLYFLEVRASGRNHVPRQGPVLLAANHPNSVLDAFLLATQTPRPIHYLARSGLFKNRLVATFLRRMRAIPVYRAAESKDSQQRNEAVFARVHELFEEGGCVGVFPEGRNSPGSRVAALRTGSARMALGAEARNGWSLGLVIVPVGLNYENRELLMASVLLRFGEPIRVADYAAQYREDPEAATDQLTADIQNALRGQALHIEDRRLDTLVNQLSEAFGQDLPDPEPDEATVETSKPPSFFKRWLWRLVDWYRRSSPSEGRAFEARVVSRQRIARVLSRAEIYEPHSVAALRQRVDRYRDHFRQIETRRVLDQSLKEPVRERLIRLRMTLYTVLMAPVAAFGLVHNLVPYVITRWLARLARDEPVRAFAYFGVGVLAFTATYVTIGVWQWRAGDMHIAAILLYVAALPPTGFAALHYRRNILIYRHKILVRTLFWDRRELIQLLRAERAELMAQFAELAARRDGEGQRHSQPT